MKILKIVIVCLLVAGVLGGGVAGLIKLTDDDAFDTKNISFLSFSVGGLDGTGAYMDTNTSIYTKDAFECQGLNITLDFDNMIEYKVYFYDQNNDFVHTTGTRTNAFVDTEVPFFAKFARIVVMPTEDDVVSTLEVNKYAKQINVSVNREQGFKNYTENLIKDPITKNSSISFTDGTVTTTEGETKSVTDYINVSDYKEALIFKTKGEMTETNCIYVYANDKSFIGYAPIAGNASLMFKSSEGVCYYNINLSSALKYGEELRAKDNEVYFLRLVFEPTSPYELYCR